MENRSKRKGVGALISGTLLSGALFSVVPVNAADMFACRDLGSGAELRSALLNNQSFDYKALEAECGEKKTEAKSDDTKAAEHKCGEGKCGDSKKADAKSDTKAAEHKCGEGKCGESKATKESKSAEQKDADSKDAPKKSEVAPKAPGTK